MNFPRARSQRPGLWLAACGVLAVSVAAPVTAQNTAGLVQLQLSETPLSSAIDMLTQRSGARIIMADPTSLAEKKITVSLDGITVEQALNSILTASKIPWYKGDDGVFYINATPPIAPIAPAEPEAYAPSLPTPARIITTEKIKLRHQTPSMVVRALGLDGNFPLDLTYESSVTSLGSKRSGLSLTPVGSMGDNVRRVHVNGKDWDVWNGNVYVSPNPLAGVVNDALTGGQEANRDIVELDHAGQIGFPRGRGRTTGSGIPGTAGAPGTAVAPGTPGVPGASAPGIGAPGIGGAAQQSGLIPEGITSIFPYPEDNSLLVRGEQDAIDELKNVIALLDVAVRQVSIKAEFVTVTDAALSAFGLNWATSVLNSNITSDIGGRGTTAGPTIILNVAQGNVDATLTALKQSSQAKTILAPLISTLNNVPAFIGTSENYPIWQSSVLQGNIGGGNIATQTVTYLPSTTQLQVLPRINRDGSVTVQISPQVSQINGFVEGPNNQSAPIIVEQQLQTVRRVQSGESIVLGGLQTKTDSTTSRGIPFLEDLPIIGRLFRSHDRRQQNSQLLIFLTPTIVDEDTGGLVSPG